MDLAQDVGSSRATALRGSSTVCPRCGDAGSAIDPVVVPSLGGLPLRRCRRCNTRFSDDPSRAVIIYSCESCGLPYGAREILPHGEQRCSACREGSPPIEIAGPGSDLATENEVRIALAERWRFLGEPTAGAYLDRLAGRLLSKIDGSLRAVRVVIVDDPRLLSLALPSGTLLISLGTLSFLEDEAELAFVLGHEIAHAISGEATSRLGRQGFASTVRFPGAADGSAWFDAAIDLIRLGYGRRRERDADARALDAMIELGYDPEGALRYLRRLDREIAAGTSGVAETALAHPIPGDRTRRLERCLHARPAGEARAWKVNREVFRRALPKSGLRAALRPVDLGLIGHEGAEAPRSARRRTILWLILGLAIVAGAAAAIGFFLNG